jgi:ketosteroid isomerase-like protein
MSQENVEIAREGLEAISAAYKTGDLNRWRRHVEKTFDSDVVLEAGSEAFTEGDWRGHDGAVGFVANQMEVLEGMWLKADEIIDVDDDLLVVLLRFGGHARHTGIDVKLSPGHVFDLRDGKVLRWRIFGDRERALEAAGLSE